MEGKLSKLRIRAFPDIHFTAPMGYFEAYFNPQSYSVSHDINYCHAEEIGAIDSEMRFVRIPPKTHTFELLIDGTGASGPKVDVQAQIAAFMLTTYNYLGLTHRPPYLILSWGRLVDKCVLQSVSVSYSLFSPQGVPLRAKLSTVFKTVSAKEITENIMRMSSPDLTHSRVVKAGDTLPLLCKEIYGSDRHYLSVAEANGLRDFRRLEPGLVIHFPPLSQEA